MGCWNETCGITQLPIFNGNPVRLFFLNYVGNSEENHAGHCYPNDIWSPQFLPIAANYNDYGGVEEVVENSLTQFVISRVREDLVSSRLSGGADCNLNRKSDDLDLLDFGIEDLVEQIHNERLWTRGTSRDLPVGWMMVHEWVYQQLTQQLVDSRRGSITVNDVVSQGQEFYHLLSAHMHTPLARQLGMSYNRWYLEDSSRNNIFGQLAGGMGLDHYGQLHGISEYLNLMAAYVEQDLTVDSPQVSELVQALAEFFCFRCHMTTLRKHWMPQSGKGSQQCDLDPYRKLMQGALEWITLQEKEWEE